MTWAMWGIAIVGLYVLALVIMKSRRGRCLCRTDLSGKTAIVTGASRGIGFQVALDLATRNARVILANRDSPKAKEATQKIREETGNSNVSHKHLDLSSLESIRAFCKDIIQEEQRLDILVNNAGISSHPKAKTKDGLEINMATNHFGPFLLTNLLLDLLKKSAPSRVIVTSSIIHTFGNINFDNLNGEKSLNLATIYSDTKLANVLFTRELSKKLQDTNVTANSLHPGSVDTDLLHNLPLVVKVIMRVVSSLFFRSAEEGAQTTIHLAVSPELAGVTGKYFSECKEKAPSDKAMDDGVARKLWEESERLTGLT